LTLSVGDADAVEADACESFLPGLREPAPGLRAVTDDGEAARWAAKQQHVPRRVGELLCLVHDDVGERPGEAVRVAAADRLVVDQSVAQVAVPQALHQAEPVVVRLDEPVDDLRQHLFLSGRVRLPPHSSAGHLRVTEALPCSVQQRQVRHGPGLRVAALQPADVVRAQPGRAAAQERRHGPQVADEVRRVDQRPGPGDGGTQVVVLQQPAAQLLERRAVGLVDQEPDHRLLDLVARLVVRRARFCGAEGLGPVVGVQLKVRPRCGERQRAVGGSS
jgi:hypothetical protein